jgi:hypothetical protein
VLYREQLAILVKIDRDHVDAASGRQVLVTLVMGLLLN